MDHHHTNGTHETMHHYRKFLIMTILSFAAMYILMYAMVDTFANVLPNVNQIYMAALMTAAMVLIEMGVMGGMYKNRKYNMIIISSGAILLVASFFAIRVQTAVSDRQFLKSMVPHHAAAILMVKEAKIQDPQIQKLAEEIITSQQKEIDFMKAELKAIDHK
jgi:uncharacterized protein (DUF305 family)